VVEERVFVLLWCFVVAIDGRDYVWKGGGARIGEQDKLASGFGQEWIFK